MVLALISEKIALYLHSELHKIWNRILQVE